MKTCLIYGHDGLDLDVTYNLRSFYRKLGFRVFFSRILYDADILVVTRALDREINLSGMHYALIHVYDYTGWDYDAFVRSVDQGKTYIFCTSESRKERLINQLNFPEDKIFIALPPVDVTIWCKKLKDLKYPKVHIGNFKQIADNDTIRILFNEALTHLNIHIWGSGWKGFNKLYHGKAGLFQVSSIYSKSEFAFGLMYPFQRGNTFSGRFWHAPLNGCSLLSEAGYFTSKIPGIIETDYSLDDIKEKTDCKTDRKKVQKESIEFWEKQNEITLGYIKITLISFKEQRFSTLNYLNFIHKKICNTLFKCYQKSGLSRFIIRK